MASNHQLRFTGENPPLPVLERYFNWEFALDEEGLDGQDETTLRPAQEQTCINDSIAHTAGVATGADKRQLPALIALTGGEVQGFWVYDQAGDWCLVRSSQQRRWQPFVQSWLPERERCRSIELSNGEIFPLRIETRLPFALTGMPWRASIGHDGRATSF